MRGVIKKGDCKICVFVVGAVDIFVKLFKEGVCLFVCLIAAVKMVGYLLVRSSCWNRERPNKRIAKLVFCILVLENFVD